MMESKSNAFKVQVPLLQASKSVMKILAQLVERVQEGTNCTFLPNQEETLHLSYENLNEALIRQICLNNCPY